MDEHLSASKADALLALLITNHPGLFGEHPARSPESGKKLAETIAALRQQLIEDLKKQAV